MKTGGRLVARPILLVGVGRRTLNAAAVRDDRAVAGHAARARRVADPIVATNVRGKEADGNGVGEIGCRRDPADYWGLKGSRTGFRMGHGIESGRRTESGAAKWKESEAKTEILVCSLTYAVVAYYFNFSTVSVHLDRRESGKNRYLEEIGARMPSSLGG